MKKIKEKDLAAALEAIKMLLKDGVLPKEYDGYASAIGASIINSGLLPTLSFYTDIHKEKDKDSSEVRRFKLLKVIYKVIEPETSTLDSKGLLDYTLNKVFSKAKAERPGDLGDLDRNELSKLKKRILEAATAVKMAMRNFPHSDS